MKQFPLPIGLFAAANALKHVAEMFYSNSRVIPHFSIWAQPARQPRKTTNFTTAKNEFLR